MQPDPALIEKQKQEQMIRKQRVDILRVLKLTFNLIMQQRKEDDYRKQQYMEEEKERKQMMDMQDQNYLEELSDYDNMVDEN